MPDRERGSTIASRNRAANARTLSRSPARITPSRLEVGEIERARHEHLRSERMGEGERLTRIVTRLDDVEERPRLLCELSWAPSARSSTSGTRRSADPPSRAARASRPRPCPRGSRHHRSRPRGDARRAVDALRIVGSVVDLPSRRSSAPGARPRRARRGPRRAEERSRGRPRELRRAAVDDLHRPLLPAARAAPPTPAPR